MSSTNKTANYELSQFVGTDIPSILSDYNGDMRKIDAGIAEVATSAGSSASAVSALAGRVTTAENSITSLNGALEVTNQRSIQNQTAITAVQGVIPSDASTENLLATVDEVGDVADNVRGVDTRVQAVESEMGSATLNTDLNYDGEHGIKGCINLLYDGWHKQVRQITPAEVANYATNGDLVNEIQYTVGQIGGAHNVPYLSIEMCIENNDLVFRMMDGSINSSSTGWFAIKQNGSNGITVYSIFPSYSEVKKYTFTTSGMTVTDLSSTAPTAGTYGVRIFA